MEEKHKAKSQSNLSSIRESKVVSKLGGSCPKLVQQKLWNIDHNAVKQSANFPSRPTGFGLDYWTISKGVANRTGWSCRQCKRVIMVHENVIVRDGRKMRFFYHHDCYSGEPDPRTQEGSSYEFYKGIISDTAPEVKGRGKWSVNSYGYVDNL